MRWWVFNEEQLADALAAYLERELARHHHPEDAKRLEDLPERIRAFFDSPETAHLGGNS